MQHETDEVLGISSCIDTSGTVLTNSCNNSAPAAIDAGVKLTRGASSLRALAALLDLPLTALRRAGADFVLTYFAREIAEVLNP